MKFNRVYRNLFLSSIPTGTLAYVVIDEEKRRNISSIMGASYRILNMVGTVGTIVTDYTINYYLFEPKATKYDKLMTKLNNYQNDQEIFTRNQWDSKSKMESKLWKTKINETRKKINETSEALANLSSEGGSSSLSKIHDRCSKRLRDLCIKNKGVYIKLGQHLSQLDHVLPEEYPKNLRCLLSNNPKSDWESVQRVITEDLHSSPELLWDKIDSNPIACASLAQVHVAYDKEGNKYAVKVQHESLKQGAKGDLIAITFVIELISKMFKDFTYTWLTREMNRNLPDELNFTKEAENAELCAFYLKNLSKTGDVVIPKIKFKSERVLCMSFEEGEYISNEQYLKEKNINKSELAKLISSVFCQQIYKHGFVHCDPHEANLLVRPHPAGNGRPQLVLLDHGLYRKLEDDFKNHYCKLWRGIVNADEKEIKLECSHLNAGTMYTLLAAMLTMRPWDDIVADDIDRLNPTGSKKDSQMLKAYANKYLMEIVTLLGGLPSDLLLVMKTNDCLRHLDRSLGVPVNTVIVVANTVADVILAADLQEAHGSILKIIYAWLDYINTILRAAGLQFLSVYLKFWGLI